MAQSNPYPLRIDKIIMEKFKYLASSNGRSVNKEIEFLMKQTITMYERENGEIKVDLDA